MRYLIFFIICYFLSLSVLNAQISPPGLGKANTATWLALGIRQSLDSMNHKQSMTYIGMGRISNPNNYNSLQKPSIFVINEEFYHQLHKHWQYSVAVSYRRQNVYKDNAPYASGDPSVKQEFRLYGRYIYVLKSKRFKFAGTYRQELRKFYAPDFSNTKETFQLRSRFRGQLTFNLDKGNNHRIIASAEALLSASQQESSWTSFGYHESRFGLYYSFSPNNKNLIYSIGYMNNLIGKVSITDVHYLSLDVIWENPFGNPMHKKPKPVKYLE